MPPFPYIFAWPLTLTYGLLTRLSIDTIYSFKDLYNTDLEKLSFKFSELDQFIQQGVFFDFC